jgi:hypothetical protein
MSEEILILPELHENQEKVMREAKRFNVLDCGRRWGKSVLAINLISETAIDGFPAGYFTPTYKLLEGTYREALLALTPIVSRKHDNQFIELVTGGIIEFWSLDNPNAGRSRKYKRAVVDEAAFAKELWESWNNSIRPTLTDLIGDGWIMSTPRGKNGFYKLYSKGASGEKNWMSWQMPTHTNPYIDKNELEDARRELPESAYNQEYLALFSDNAANPFGVDHIRRVVKPISNNPTACFGIDLAKSVDWTVVTGLDRDGNVSFFERWQSDWSQTKERIKRIIGNKPTFIDSTGVGDPIVEEIQKTCGGVEKYFFTSQSKQKLMEGLASSIQSGKVSVLDGIMKDELESFEFVYGRTGVKYSAPEGLHDDCVCSLALASLKNNDRPAPPILTFHR